MRDKKKINNHNNANPSKDTVGISYSLEKPRALNEQIILLLNCVCIGKAVVSVSFSVSQIIYVPDKKRRKKSRGRVRTCTRNDFENTRKRLIKTELLTKHNWVYDCRTWKCLTFFFDKMLPVAENEFDKIRTFFNPENVSCEMNVEQCM